jgi:hypothetical protein
MWRLTDEQRELRERIREFVLAVVRPRMLQVDETCDYPFDVHHALAREGLIGLAIPEEFGGRGATSVSFGAYIEELAKVSATASLMAAYVSSRRCRSYSRAARIRSTAFWRHSPRVSSLAPMHSQNRTLARIQQRCRRVPSGTVTDTS